MKGVHQIVAYLLGAIAVASGVTGCQTNNTEPAPYPRAASRIPFVPVLRQAAIQAGEGAYPNLFTAASNAQWGTIPGATSDTAMPLETVPKTTVETGDEKVAPASATLETEMDSDIESMGVKAPPPGPLTILCFLESEFPDRSIAYDAVGLRGMEVHLELPDGQVLLPAQRILDSQLGEVPVGALRRYSRTLTLIFPSGTFQVENPVANPAAKGVRLVLTGHSSTFYFEWRASPDHTVPTAPRADYQAREAASKYYRATKERVKRVSHTLD